MSMIDLSKVVPMFGTVETRGLVAVQWLRDNDMPSGFFHQNGHQIIVYPDSTERELSYQYAYSLGRYA